jgi:hypothetical protein
MKSSAILGLLASVVVVAAAPASAGESWFEGRWIFDEDASIESITDGHPYALACNTGKSADGAPTTQCITLKEKLGDLMAGQRASEWMFESERAALLDDGVVQARYVYTINAIEEGTFELQLKTDELQFASTVQRTRAGFCMTPFGGDYPTHFDRGSTFSGCYKRSSNPRGATETMPSIEEMPVTKVALMQDDVIVVNGVAMGIAELQRALATLKTAHGSVIYYREGSPAQPTSVELEVNKAVNDARVPLMISTEADFSTVILPDGTVGNRE